MRGSLLLLPALACSGGELGDVRLDLPVEGSHRSVIVGIGEVPREIHARAIDENGEIDAPIVAGVSADDRVYALLYERALDELAMVSGQLIGTAEGRALPGASVVLESRLDATGWREIALPESLEAFRFGGQGACAAFDDARVIDLGGTGRVTALFTEAEAVLVTVAALDDRSGRILRVTRDGAVETLHTGPPIYSGYRDGAGDYWFGGAGEVLHARIDVAGLEVVATSSPTLGGIVRVLAGDEERPGPAVQFAVTDPNAMERFDGNAWSVLDRFDPALGCIYGTARVSDDEAVVGWEDALIVRRWVGGVFEEERLPANALNNGVSELKHLPGYGTIAGTQIGEVIRMREADDTWVKLEGTYATISVRDVVRYRDGFLYVDDRGVFNQYSDRLGGYCAPVASPEMVGQGEHSLTNVGGDVVVGGYPVEPDAAPKLFWFPSRGG